MTIHAELLVQQESEGGYITYVFADLDKVSYAKDRYVMCTRFPNWEVSSLKVGDKGYLDYKEIIAGRDSWYNPNDQQFYAYRYNTIQFINFIKEKAKSDEIIM